MSGSIGGIDASIPLSAGKGVAQNPMLADPMATFQKFAAIRALNNENALFGQKFAGQQALGHAYADNTNPDGTLNMPGVMQSISRDPNTAFVAPEAFAAGQKRELEQFAIAKAQQEVTAQRLNYDAGQIAPLVSLGDKVTLGDVTSVMARLNHGGYPTDEFVHGMATLPATSGPALAEWVRRVVVGALPPSVQASLYNTQGVNNGAGTKFVTTSTLANPSAPGTFVKSYLTPAERSTQQPIINNGTIGSVPMQTLAPPGTVMPSSDDVLGDGRYHGSAANTAPAAPAPAETPLPAPAGAPTPGPATPAAPGAPAGFHQTTFSPGQTAAASAYGQATGGGAADLLRAAGTVNDQKGLLGNMDANLNDFTSGPGKAFWNTVKARANSWSPTPIFEPGPIASQEEFGKLAMQLAQQQFHTLGGTGTDAKLDSTLHTSPSVALSNLGSHSIIALLKGNADAIGTMNREWQTKWLPAHGNDPNTYGQFVTDWNSRYDPRVFQSQYVKNPQEMLKGMTPAEVTKFRQDYNTAVANGWIPDPRAANAGQ